MTRVVLPTAFQNFRQEWPMRLEPLYRIRFSYPESWAVALYGGWEQMLIWEPIAH